MAIYIYWFLLALALLGLELATGTFTCWWYPSRWQWVVSLHCWMRA